MVPWGCSPPYRKSCQGQHTWKKQSTTVLCLISKLVQKSIKNHARLPWLEANAFNLQTFCKVCRAFSASVHMQGGAGLFLWDAEGVSVSDWEVWCVSLGLGEAPGRGERGKQTEVALWFLRSLWHVCCVWGKLSSLNKKSAPPVPCFS